MSPEPKAHESSRYMMNSATRKVIKDQSSNLIKQNIRYKLFILYRHYVITALKILH